VHVGWTIFIGFIVGAVAKLLTPGTGVGGFFVNAALGIAGSFVGVFVGQYLGWNQAGLSAIFLGFLGAIILLMGYHLSRHGPY
jgi:uncharacterized membrane protein YeaQ/YmgE (transglycosylase-associated protein family)